VRRLRSVRERSALESARRSLSRVACPPLKYAQPQTRFPESAAILHSRGDTGVSIGSPSVLASFSTCRLIAKLIVRCHRREAVRTSKYLAIQWIVINRRRVYVLELFALGHKAIT